MKTTKKQLKLAKDACCPFCGEQNIDAGHVMIDSGNASQNVECLDCNASWYEIYKLVSIEKVES